MYTDGEPSAVTYRLVMMGKTGSGKSTLCNSLLRHSKGDVFPVYSGTEGQTMAVKEEILRSDDYTIHLVDTPDLYNMGTAQLSEREAIFDQWQQLPPTAIPTAILLVLRSDARYTPEVSKLYKNYRQRLPRQYQNNVIIAFTRFDHLNIDMDKEVQVGSLRDLLTSVDNRYVAAYHPMTDRQRRETIDKIVRFVVDFKDGRETPDTPRTSWPSPRPGRLVSAFRWVAGLALTLRDRTRDCLLSTPWHVQVAVTISGLWFAFLLKGLTAKLPDPLPPDPDLSPAPSGVVEASLKVVCDGVTRLCSITGIRPDVLALLLFSPY